MKNVIIGTAGHVDHGKTSLVKALTGVDCDRLKEEKERGLTIDLGHAYLDLGNDRGVSIVDVPGHERFVKTMLAGAQVIDCVLFLIAADEGVMPQTVEHFDIINLLGIQHGIVVLTKVDMVDQEWLELVEEDIAKFIKGTSLEKAPIIRTSAVTGEGLDVLKKNIGKLFDDVDPKDAHGIFRLPIDWTFGVSGLGSVICGIAFSGKAKLGDKMEVVPQQREVRIRGIQAHGRESDEMSAGQLVAVNLSGIELSEMARGDVLTIPNYLRPTYMLDARLHLLADSSVVLENRTRIRLHLACSEVLGRVVLLDKEIIAPGDTGLIQFRLEEKIAAEYGDRFVIRQYSPMRTIGGGIILDTCPVKHKRFKPYVVSYLEAMEKGSPKERVEQVLVSLRTESVTLEDLVRETNIVPDEIGEILNELALDQKVFTFGREQHFMHIDWHDKIAEAIIDILGQFHKEQPLKLGMSREELRTRLPYEAELTAYSQILQNFMSANVVIAEGERVRLAEHTIQLSEAHEAIRSEIEEVYRSTGFATPLPEDTLRKWTGKDAQMAQEAMDVLMETGVLIQADEKVFFHQEAIDEAKKLISQHIRSHGKLTLNDCRQLLQATRKYMLPILYYLDEIGVTRRIGDDRVLRGGTRDSNHPASTT